MKQRVQFNTEFSKPFLQDTNNKNDHVKERERARRENHL